ncbi:FRG domain-containing protein [Rhizobium lusitanum]|uniref:FRG domain-containing protein n=1 Tax=Rhizobium lusitanum TaxID=293958 RepID=A0A6L9UJK8_9HYPH|nr:FRG domain-containing protein [Rhizobium lusitanum]NEI74317.1 FRG domain-containing protein [Rhizobium lusitanum]
MTVTKGKKAIIPKPAKPTRTGVAAKKGPAASRTPPTAESVTDYLQLVFDLPQLSEGAVRCYRGEADATWKLKPSIMRGVRSEAENRIFSELMLEAPTEFSSDKAMFDKLVRAQHYGLPTRLLDVSLNPLVGLYFACNEEPLDDKDGRVRVFDFVEKRVKYADSDTISLICNLARLSDGERSEISSAYSSAISKENLQKFRSLPAVERLLQFVRVEKPYFLNLVKPSDLFRYFFVYPAKNNRRVIAQSGAFIAAGLLRYRSPETTTSYDLHTIVVPAAKKAQIRNELDTININSRTMFPEVEFASKYIRRKWTI